MVGTLPIWQIWAIASAVNFLPGMLVGGLLGSFIIRPVNAVLGFLFGGFNRWFDWMTGLYGRGVGRTLRLSSMVLVIYAGLLGLTCWQFQRTPTGFIPQQDKGYLLLNVQLPDSASVERTKRAMAHIEQLAHDMPGIEHTVGLSGQSLILNANAPNLGSMYILLKPFDERHNREAERRRDRQVDAGALPRGSAGGGRLGLRRAAHRRPGHDRRLQADR